MDSQLSQRAVFNRAICAYLMIVVRSRAMRHWLGWVLSFLAIALSCGGVTALEPGELVQEIFPRGSEWRYLAPQGIAENPETATNVDFLSEWMLPEYDDQAPLQLAGGTQLSWQGPSPAPIQYGGIAGFGANDDGTNLIQPAEGDRYTHYFRREFTLEEPISQLEFQFVIDDGAVVYIDGVEIFRPGCCTPNNTPPRFQDLSSASGNELTIFLISPDLPPELVLDAGTHTIAVEVHQRDPASSDLGFDLGLIQNGPGLVWDVDNSGDWEDFANWRLLARPNGSDEIAYFGDVITSPQTIVADRDFLVQGIEFESPHRYAIAGIGSLTLESHTGVSRVTVAQGHHEFQLSFLLNNDAELDIAADGSLEFNNDVALNGNQLIKIGEGDWAINNRLDAGENGQIVAAAGAVSGSGVVSGEFVNRAKVMPGRAGIGKLTLGDFIQHSDGELIIEIGGTDSSQYDVLRVDGTATLAGGLDVRLLGQFSPALGDHFDVLEAETIAGQFDQLDLPNLSEGFTWDTSQLYDIGRLSVVPEPNSSAILLLCLIRLSFERCRHQVSSRGRSSRRTKLPS